MNNDLAGKRLLYLGGISRARYVIERARQLGVYTIVADYNEDSPAKAVADEGVLVDAMDVDALEKVCKEKSVDGVMTGYCDILLPICKKLSEKMGFSCYYTEDMLRFTTDKNFFKEVCKKHGVPVPDSFYINEKEIEDTSARLPYPIFIKPIDASGSRGASACYSQNEFFEKYKWAKSFSKRGNVSVEEFLFGTEFILDYAIVNGDLRLMSMADRYCIDGRSAAVNSPNLMILPSKYLKKYNKEIDSCVRELVSGEGYENGILFFQGYANDAKITFYEAGCRLGGTWPYIVEHYSMINPMDMLFNYSLTGSMLPREIKNTISAQFDGYAAIIYLLSNRKSGRIWKINGVDDVKKMPFVVHYMQYYEEGDFFETEHQTDVRFAAVHLVARSFSELKTNIRKVCMRIDFLDSLNSSLLMRPFNVDELTGYNEEVQK